MCNSVTDVVADDASACESPPRAVLGCDSRFFVPPAADHGRLQLYFSPVGLCSRKGGTYDDEEAPRGERHTSAAAAQCRRGDLTSDDWLVALQVEMKTKKLWLPGDLINAETYLAAAKV